MTANDLRQLDSGAGFGRVRPSGVTLLFASLLCAPILFLFPGRVNAQAAPFRGAASVSLSLQDGAVSEGSNVRAALVVDLTAVTGKSASGSPTAAALGGYQIAADFNKILLEFVSALGGTSAGFTEAPVFTNPSRANETGE